MLKSSLLTAEVLSLPTLSGLRKGTQSAHPYGVAPRPFSVSHGVLQPTSGLSGLQCIHKFPHLPLPVAARSRAALLILCLQIISLIYGDNWHMFNPGNDGLGADHDEYELTILKEHHQFLGPFPVSYNDIPDPDGIRLIIMAMEGVPTEKMKPFHYITTREMAREDNAFLLKIMKLDPRDRPTAKEILEDEWFREEV